jgi:pimeloyl-ACP methyl ester carboxylesterase
MNIAKWMGVPAAIALAACGTANVAPQAAMPATPPALQAASVGTTSGAPTKTIVLVHGAFADGSSWEKVVPQLQAKGFNVAVVQNPLTSLMADVEATQRVIDQQTTPVILVGHSWGGTVITQAGVNDKVVALVYVCAFAPDEGQSTNDLTRAFGPPSWAAGIRADSGGFLSLSRDTVAHDFAQDLSTSVTNVMAATQGPIQAKALDDKVTRAAWHTKPVTYIVGTNDHMIPAALERTFAKKLNATTVELPTSHVAMLSRPDDVVAAIVAAAERAR